uniref:Protein kinase domain-containing protein n=1 Tax=Oryza barthii TaxID=65489 RepID=A0A0D3HC56_9ORYZ
MTNDAAPDLTWERWCKIICSVASALEYLHRLSNSRILHRDVKASNVMLDEEYTKYSARLDDFGLARVIQLSTRSLRLFGRCSNPAPPPYRRPKERKRKKERQRMACWASHRHVNVTNQLNTVT